MNAKKGKGKPRPNKPTNPNLPQKEESEKVEKELEEFESAPKIEDRVPEIISEVVTPSVADNEEKDDSPKKPKRNRGKKKKNEKDESETQDETKKQSEIVENVQLEMVEIEAKDVPVEETVAPSARKKKNKNKKPTDSEAQIVEKPDKEIKTEIIKVDAGLMMEEDSTVQDVDSQEVKTSKKKNKKKKQRNDSEKSDTKSEEISCTSAFQRLLKDDKSDSKISVNKPIPTEANLPEPPKEEMNIGAFIQELEKVEDIDYVSQEIKTTGKNKKKNKKDKKEPPKDTESEMTTEISYMTAIKPVSKEEFTLQEEQLVKRDQPSEAMVPANDPKLDEDGKPKAKIAKPVERKRKGKGEKAEELTSEKTTSTEQDNVFKEVLTSELLKDVAPSMDTPKPIEILTEKGEEQLPIIDTVKEDVAKPMEKKRKGKGNKHENDNTIENVQSEDIKKSEEAIALTQALKASVTKSDKIFEQTGIKTDANKEGTLNTSLKEETVKENKRELEKMDPKAERKRKGKKDTKSQEMLLEHSFKGEDLKVIESTAAMTENIQEITNPSKETETNSSAKEIKSKSDISKQTKIAKQDEIVQESKPEIAIQIADIPSKSEFLKDVPLMPDPIENIQTKQEFESNVATISPICESDELKETSFITAPENVLGKKRKKSPKPPKHKDETKAVEKSFETVISSETIMPVPAILETQVIETLPVILHEQETKIEESKPDTVQPEATTELLLETDEKTPFETKQKKKRKKSPKPPKEPEVIPELKGLGDIKEEKIEKRQDTSIPAAIDLTNEEEKVKKTKDIAKEAEIKSDIFYDLPSDLEIRSLKADESEGSTCGFTPDIIQYPRATSQDPIDDNNNMLIQEITLAEEVKLQIPLQVPDTPLIQGSGATPIETPENILVGIKISHADVKVSKGEPEKTDLKSKMMEVNQDMEELRISIERSLAELTAIEKSEGEIEKEFENRKIMSEEHPSEVKISMPSEIVAKTQSEKLESVLELEPEKTNSKGKKKQSKKMDSEMAGPSPSSIPNTSIQLEPHIPPRISMFFNKELKDTQVELSPDVVKQESASVAAIPKVQEKVEDAILPPVSSSTIDTQIKQENITPIPPTRKDKSASKERESKDSKTKAAVETLTAVIPLVLETTKTDIVSETISPPTCPPLPARKDNKNKGKNKKKGKQEPTQTVAETQSTSTITETKDTKEDKKEEKSEKKPETSQEKGKQQADLINKEEKTTEKEPDSNAVTEFEPIENFEDAMTSSADDINKTFEMIANEASRSIEASNINPEIKIVAPVEDRKKERRDEKINPVSQPKNLLGHPDIPVRLNKTDYKKEKNKTPNAASAKVKIKDSIEIESKKQTKDTQTDNIKKFMKSKSIDESFSSVTNENDEFVYKYSFRKVFLQSACHVCKKDLKQARVPCHFCNLVFYCNAKHKDEDWPQHQGLCFAISTIVHLKDQKHIYADAQNVTGQNYRLLRMQMIVSCERVLKRKLCAWEQEALLYPRMCADVSCREWRQNKLLDCDGCGQISYCASNPSHLPKSHQRWCKSYSLYQKLVCHQQTKGRLEPKLPSKVMLEEYRISEKINETLAAMYEEKIDMNDIQYAALTQIATAPLTAAYCHQTYASSSQANGTYKKTACTVHVVGGELQFEAGALNKWEIFFLHVRPRLQDLRVVMVGADLNPSQLPLELLAKVRLCDTCRFNKRRLVFSFQDKTTYHDYRASDYFVTPDIVCAFNPSIKRSSMYNGGDPWPKTVNCVLKQKVPFLVSAHTMTELQRDLARIKECSEVDVKVMIDPKLNPFGSVRPDRNFISDDEMPLLFKNYSYMLVCGVN